MIGFTLGQLAEALDAALDGDPDRVVTGVAPLETASSTDLAFVTTAAYEAVARTSNAGAFVAPVGTTGLPAPVLGCTVPQRAMIDVLTMFHPPAPVVPGVDRSAVVDARAVVDPTACIGPLVIVEAEAIIGPRVRIHGLAYVGRGVFVDADAELHPGVVLRQGVTVGRRVIIHANAVLGADGFGFRWEDGRHRKIPQVGRVVIEDDVEIGAGTTVDRATLGVTLVRQGTKIDNLVQVAHNVEIGEQCVIAAQTGIAGSSRLGRGVVLAGQVGIGDHVTVGDGAIMSAQSGTTKDVPAGARMGGSWARPIVEAQRVWIAAGELPEMVKRLRRLEQRVAELEARAPHGGRG